MKANQEFQSVINLGTEVLLCTQTTVGWDGRLAVKQP